MIPHNIPETDTRPNACKQAECPNLMRKTEEVVVGLKVPANEIQCCLIEFGYREIDLKKLSIQ